MAVLGGCAAALTSCGGSDHAVASNPLPSSGVAAHGRPTDTAKDSGNQPSPFTLAVLPDTQYYTAHKGPAAGPFNDQTRWIAANAHQLGIAFVLHEGDVVDDACNPAQWRVASTAMGRLEHVVPYAIAPGNHDILTYRAPCSGRDGLYAFRWHADTRSFNRSMPGGVNFPIARQRAASPSTWGGSFPRGDASNSFHQFHAGGVDWLVITLQFGPTAAMVDWAGRIADAHPHDHVILVTHDYLAADGSLRGSSPTQTDLPSNPGELTGREIWERLVAPRRNIQFVLNGHVKQCQAPPESRCAGTGVAGRRVARNAAGRPVYQMVADYQIITNGGNGYLRLLRIDPGASTVSVTTYSPLTRRQLVDARNRFVFRGVDLAPW